MKFIKSHIQDIQAVQKKISQSRLENVKHLKQQFKYLSTEIEKITNLTGEYNINCFYN